MRERRPQLLDEIKQACITTYGEFEGDEFLPNYLPIEGHAGVLEPGVHIVIGDRGAGKSALFHAGASPKALQALAEMSSRGRLPTMDRLQWVTGFDTAGKVHPTVPQLRTFATSGETTDRCQLFWLGLLARCLAHEVKTADDLAPWGEAGLSAPQALADAVTESLDQLIAQLDALDSRLQREDRHIYVAYDDLDKFGAGDWGPAAALLQGLMQFWASHVRRWPRIVPKIFLRRDLYERHALVGVDASKLAGRRVELRWSARDLYAVLLKRLVNHSQALRDFLEGVLPEGKQVDGLGWTPTARDEDSFVPAIERLCGRYMGAGPTKGQVFTWIPNHIEDAHGRIVPRSMIHLFHVAADVEGRRAAGTNDPPLHHTSLRAAIDRVSDRRIEELGEEYTWVRPIADHLRGLDTRLQVPVEAPKLHRALADTAWPTGIEPPERTGAGLFAALEDLGVFYRRQDGRADVRDLYLSGFGLKRKGGVARSRAWR